MAGTGTKIAVLVVSAALTVMSWWAPFKLGGWGWFGLALAGPVIVVLMIYALVFPGDAGDLLVPRRRARKRPVDKWESAVVSMAIASGVIHGAVFGYVNWR